MFWRDSSPETTYTFRGNRIPISLAFDNVLTTFEVLEHNTFNMMQKLDVIFEVFVDEVAHEYFSLDLRIEFVLKLLKDKLDIDLTKEAEEDDTIPLFDWVEDAGRIHASFLFDYGMDLREQHGKLSWSDFWNLFENLSDDSPMGIALHYRKCPIPKLEKGGYNADEVKRVKQNKELYALKDERIVEKIRRIKGKEALARMEAHKRKVKGG